MDFLFEPVPHEEARRFIASKPVLAKAVFNGLLPDLKARAFTISGIESLNVVQKVRDTITELPAGGDWDTIKKQILEDISPWFDPIAAEKRAELLIRMHGGQAYSAAAWEVMDRQRDVFPFWQYATMGDGHVRDTHQALDGITLPHDSPFWQEHYPPWEWGCRCQIIPVSEDDAADIRKTDQERGADQKLLLEGAAKDQLENNNRLIRGLNQNLDLRPPSQRQGSSGYRFNPATVRMTAAQLKDRYSPDVWDQFEQWARGTEAGEAGNLWAWLGGESTTKELLTSTGVVQFEDKEHTQNTINKIFGRNLTQQEIASLFGLPDNATLTLQNPYSESFDTLDAVITGPNISEGRIFLEKKGGEITIKAASLYVENQQSREHGGSILGLARMVNTGQKLGVSKIVTFASTMEGDTGFFTWPKLGFDAPLDSKLRAAAPFSVSKVSDLMLNVEGRKWWKSNAREYYQGAIPMEFDLKEDSLSQRVFGKIRNKILGV